MASDDNIFDDANLLGQSLTMLPGEHDPFNVNIIEGDKSTVVGLADEMHKAQFADGNTYLLPKNVRANIGNRKTVVNSIRVESGDELAQELDASASLSGSYAGFSASASAQYSYGSSLSSTKYYALLSVDHTSFTLALEGHGETDSRINSELVQAVKKLPEWDLTQEVHDKYVNVGAEYNGIAKVKGDVSVKGSNEYKSYLKTRQFQTKVYGGSSSSSLILGNAPDEAEKYQEAFNDWANSLNDAVASNLINVKIDSIGNLLSNSSVQEHNNIADKLVKALDFLASKWLADGFLKLCLPKESPSQTHVRELSIQGTPGVLIRQGSQEKPRLEIDCTVWENETFIMDGGWDAVQVVLQPPSASKSEIQLLYSGLDNTKWMEEIRMRGARIEGDVVINGVIPITILAPPTALTGELSNPTSQSLTNTDLDFSPRGPKLHLAEGKTKEAFKVRSLFLPGFGGNDCQIGACFTKD
ncbi:uncharacterized protein PGRI_024570 [Penicillium griseofulvum]|uniref:MACPF domain-containing protein n=1 Tax=Penicillium patulum TaxID=5078 RepID=A0A135LHZ8_PENPA|nr:uncharacterized protein PGRI_024570 [Penicillium griseofulvum]KXG48587.1 hypothetical protein PGRI_024570 [Penicillium griseofulvum]